MIGQFACCLEQMGAEKDWEIQSFVTQTTRQCNEDFKKNTSALEKSAEKCRPLGNIVGHYKFGVPARSGHGQRCGHSSEFPCREKGTGSDGSKSANTWEDIFTAQMNGSSLDCIFFGGDNEFVNGKKLTCRKVTMSLYCYRKEAHCHLQHFP